MISEALLSGSIGPATEVRGGTEAEVLSLALLVVCGCDVDDAADRAVQSWCGGVIADSPGYLDGAPWTSPLSWRGTRQALAPQFKAWIKPPPPGISIELKRGIMCALALQFETTLVAPPVGSLEKYLGACSSPAVATRSRRVRRSARRT